MKQNLSWACRIVADFVLPRHAIRPLGRAKARNAFIRFTAFVLLSAPLLAKALDFSDCTVGEIVVAGDQNAHVQLSCAVSNAPACAVAPTYVGFDKSTAAGKQYLALFMLAQATGGKVAGLVDHASCPAWQGNVAYLSHLRVSK
jgi:hypothetical protein